MTYLMRDHDILGSREVKKIREQLIDQYNLSDFPKGVWVLDKKHKKLYLTTETIAKVIKKLKHMQRIGFYFGQLMNEGIRLSFQAAFEIAPLAKKNVISINELELDEYMQGHNIKKKCDVENTFVIIKHKDYVLGCAKYKQGEIINYVPKEYRGEYWLLNQ